MVTTRTLVVGIAGGTASGKTTLTKAIASDLGDLAVVLSHDDYYRQRRDLSFDERVQLNYDHPDAYDTELLVDQLSSLRQGQPVEVPVYDFSIYDRTDEVRIVRPAPVVIIEGIMILCEKALRDLMDVKVFVDTDADVRILRRALRDVTERGRSLDSVITQYLTTVKPMHELFVEPSKRYADFVVPMGGSYSVARTMLVEAIRSHICAEG